MPFPVTGTLPVALFLLMCLLSIRVSLARGRLGVALGDGGNATLHERIRQQANFTENVPFALVLLGIAEAEGLSSRWLWISALILMAARLIHPFGIRQDQPANPLRIIGVIGT